jgi:hypothetical protein
MKNTENTKNNATQKTQSTMNTLKRARTLNFYNDETKCTESIKIVAESDKAYKTSDNKVVKKSDVEKKQVLKNTIDYRYNTSEEDEKFTKIQERLCKVLEIDLNSDIRAFEKIFSVRQTKRYYNILISDSVILNRASSIELLLTESDKAKLEKKFDCVVVEKTESKLDKYTKHIKLNENENIYSLVLKTKSDIQKVAKMLK